MADFPRNHPSRGHFVSTFGAVHQSHSSQKTKKPLSQQRDKGNILCGTTLLAGQTRPATQVLPGNGGIRRGLLYSSALCSKVMFPGSSRPPCTQTAALCASQRRVLLLFHAVFLICQNILSVFSVAVKGKGFIFLIGEAGVPFCLPKKEPKRHQGTSFDEHPACAGVHRRRPLDPRLRGTPSSEIPVTFRRPKTRPCFLLAPGTQAPTKWKFGSIRAVRTPPTWAKPWQLGSCRVRDHRRTKQVGRHQAVYDRGQTLANFDGKGPCGPRIERKPVNILPAGIYQTPKGTRSRNRGTGGRLPLSGGDGPKGQRG